MKVKAAGSLVLILMIVLVLAYQLYTSHQQNELAVKATTVANLPSTRLKESVVLYAVLDLNKDGFNVEALKKPPVLFDHVGKGIRVGTSWIAPSNGFLVLDRNGNGIVDDGTELLGNRGRLVSGKKADNSFAVLAEEDSNHDGVIDAKDPIFSKLLVWQDSNQDGISQTEELKPVSKYGIVLINVKETGQRLVGAKTVKIGSYKIGGEDNSVLSEREFADIDFEIDTYHRAFVKTVPLSSDAKALPDVEGTGIVRDMREAASLSPGFAKQLAEYAAVTTRDEQIKLIDGLVREWGNTSGYGGMQAGAAANGYSLVMNLDAIHQSYLTTLEQFNGRSFFAVPWEEHIGRAAIGGLTMKVDGGQKLLKVNLVPEQANHLDKAYSELKESIYQVLLLQTRLHPYLKMVRVVVDGDGKASLSYTKVEEKFRQVQTENPEKAIVDLIEFNQIKKDEPNNEDWNVQGHRLLNSMLAGATLTPVLQKTLQDFSIEVPKDGKKKSKQNWHMVAQQQHLKKSDKNRNEVERFRKDRDLRYCLDLADNLKVIACTENKQ